MSLQAPVLSSSAAACIIDNRLLIRSPALAAAVVIALVLLPSAGYIEFMITSTETTPAIVSNTVVMALSIVYSSASSRMSDSTWSSDSPLRSRIVRSWARSAMDVLIGTCACVLRFCGLIRRVRPRINSCDSAVM